MHEGKEKEHKEIERVVQHGWLFDVDGVLSHLVEKKNTERELLERILAVLEKGEPVALNTGRQVSFAVEKVLKELEAMASDKVIFQNLLLVAEKGAIQISYDGDGNYKEEIDESITMPKHIQKEVRELVEKDFSDIMFFDTGKRTMISVEMVDGGDLEEFKKRQVELNALLVQLLDKHNLNTNYKLDLTRISIDLENRHVGKHLGARKVLDWLKKQKIKPQEFIAFGDSKSDLGMAEEIFRNGLKVEMVFVGGKELIEGKKFDFSVKTPESNYEKGVLEYLKSLE